MPIVDLPPIFWNTDAPTRATLIGSEALCTVRRDGRLSLRLSGPLLFAAAAALELFAATWSGPAAALRAVCRMKTALGNRGFAITAGKRDDQSWRQAVRGLYGSSYVWWQLRHSVNSSYRRHVGGIFIATT